MKLEKAIEILEAEQREWIFSNTDDNNEAVNLGIEALKVLQESRGKYGTYFARLLPGETEE